MKLLQAQLVQQHLHDSFDQLSSLLDQSWELRPQARDFVEEAGEEVSRCAVVAAILEQRATRFTRHCAAALNLTMTRGLAHLRRKVLAKMIDLSMDRCGLPNLLLQS